MKIKTVGSIVVGGLIALGVGCESYDYGYANRTSSSGYYEYSYNEPVAPAQPSLGLQDDRVDAALSARQEAAATQRAEFLTEFVSAGQPETVYDVAARIDDSFRAGQRDVGLAVAAQYENVATFDEVADRVTIDCRYRSVAGGVIELTMERSDDASKPLAVVLPPGTYGVPVTGPAPSSATEALDLAIELEGDWTDPNDERRFRDWPSAQDLAFLRAPVLTFAPGQTVAQIRVPIACAAFNAGPPQADQPYTLARFTEGSEIDQLMVFLCAEENVPAAEAQMAVWLTQNDISWEQFCSQGGNWGRLASFGSGGSVLPTHAHGAAQLMLRSGIDPRGLIFFADQAPSQELAPSAEPQEDQPQADQPQEEAPLQPAEVDVETGELS